MFLGLLVFIVGFFFWANASTTGAVVGLSTTEESFVTFLFFLAALILTLLASGLEKKITSAINKSNTLMTLAKDATRNERVQKEIDHLINELGKGNLEAGLGNPGHLDGTDIYYLRGRNGGRLYYHKIDNQEGDHAYEIVAKSAKGQNQDNVIAKLRQLYGH
jgi:hypothetical protein